MMYEGYSRERAIAARIIDKHLRRIIAEGVWKGYPPNLLASRIVDAGGFQFLLTPPFPGGAGLLRVDDNGTSSSVADNPSLIGPAKTALTLLREHVDGLPPLPRSTERLSKDDLARLRTVVNKAPRRGVPLFRLLYAAENPLKRRNGGVYELILKNLDVKETGDVDTTIALLASRNETIPSMDQIYSVYHTLSWLALLEENELLAHEYGKSIPRKGTGDPDLKEMDSVMNDRYWEEAIGDISSLTHAQQYEFFNNIGRYYNDPAHDLIEAEKGAVNIVLVASPGNPIDRSVYYAETNSVLKNLRLGKLKSWTGALATISATLGTADRLDRSLSPLVRFTTFAEIPDPAGGPSIISWSNMADIAPVMLPVKLLVALRDRLAGKGDALYSLIATAKGYPLKIARIKLKAVEEAMRSGANSELARILAGEKVKKTTERKKVVAERKKSMDALKEIAMGLEKGLAGVLSLKWPPGYTEFRVPFAFSGSQCVISGRVSHYTFGVAPETKPCDLELRLGHVTVPILKATKRESIIKRLLDDSDVVEHINQSSGGPAPSSVCPPLAAAIKNPVDFVDTLLSAMDTFVEQKISGASSVKERYHNALSQYFPEDMFEEYCTAGPGM